MPADPGKVTEATGIRPGLGNNPTMLFYHRLQLFASRKGPKLPYQLQQLGASLQIRLGMESRRGGIRPVYIDVVVGHSGRKVVDRRLHLHLFVDQHVLPKPAVVLLGYLGQSRESKS